MSVVTRAIGAAKKVKHHYQEKNKIRAAAVMSPVRRIERVALQERVCAMTFDDGPCRRPCEPDRWNGKPLTLVLAETLEQYHAHGSFDVVGDTSANYPDQPGKPGTAYWGGYAYDHYPAYGEDQNGGAVHCGALMERLLAGGHEITNHTYSHRLFGPKGIVYNRRKHLNNLEEVTEDVRQLHELLKTQYGYEMHLSRPPHYVDRISKHFTSYDAYALLHYQYMAASFDGAGWLPRPSYEAEVADIWKPVEQKLREDPDYFCGQIIFHKDGCNMALRTPVADGLAKQLELLSEQGYRVVSVGELMAMSQFADVLPDSEVGIAAAKLTAHDWCPAYRDNTIRPEQVLTRGEAAMLAYGWEGAAERVALVKGGKAMFSDCPAAHPYSGAISCAVRTGAMTADAKRFQPDAPITGEALAQLISVRTGCASAEVHIPAGTITHGQAICLIADRI